MRLLIFIFMYFIALISVLGCDVCNIFEYANRRNRSYIGVFYRNRFFNGYDHLKNDHHYLHVPKEENGARVAHDPSLGETMINKTARDFQHFQTMELRFNYAINAKWNLLLILPYLWNDAYYAQTITFPNPMSDTALHVSGIGDPVITIDKVIQREGIILKHVLRPGIGIKLPIGASQLRGTNNQLYDYDLQPGTGSIDILARLNYLVTNDIWGADFFFNARICNWGKNNMRMGHKWNLMASLYYTFKLKKISWLPRTGVYYEYAARDRTLTEIYQSSGGQTLFYQLGFDIIWKEITLQMMYQKPLYERLNGPVIGNAGRLNVGLVYNFK